MTTNVMPSEKPNTASGSIAGKSENAQWHLMAPWAGQVMRFGVVILAFAWLVIVGATWNS